MKEIFFTVEFKTDVVLQASSNTQGKIDYLDFIPGSNFLGMVAKHYNEFSNPFDIFHSKKVRFGDGNILYNDKLGYKIPLSYYHKKLDDSKIYNYHFLDENKFKELKQIKQMRSGYITSEYEKVNIYYNYSQKSAYDKEKRKSKDAQMYGYRSLKSGTKWQFCLKLDDDILETDENKIVEILLKSKRLGKSRSSQYGSIKITKNKNKIEINRFVPKDNYTYLYANSRLALFSNDGNPTYDLTKLCNGLLNENICYEKTQIRTQNFTPFNAQRNTRDYERICINKGSVIVLKNLGEEQIQQLKDGVGAYLSEGFGEVIINPEFLEKKDFELKSSQNIKNNQSNKSIPSNIVKFLQEKQRQEQQTHDIAYEVEKFILTSQLKNISSSAWGKIRSIASNDENFIEKIKAYIVKGTKKWNEYDKEILDKLIEDIKNKGLDTRNFIKLLSMRITRTKDNK